MSDPNPPQPPDENRPAATPAGNPYASPTTPGAPLTAAEDRQWASWAHFGGAIVILALFTGWLALLAIVPALVIYLVYGKRGALTRDQSKEALNFQITMVGAIIIWAILAAIVFAAVAFNVGFGAWAIIVLLMSIVGWALVIIDLVFSIIAGVRVNSGGSYRYPFALRLVK